VRDKLRVLLVSGEPHAGERTWRNLLKSDANVDLVHFTILRPPEKQDGTPINELSLIAFPTRELFQVKIKEFDLIIFDRYANQSASCRSSISTTSSAMSAKRAARCWSPPGRNMPARSRSRARRWISDPARRCPMAASSTKAFYARLSDPGRATRSPATSKAPRRAAALGRWFRMVGVRAAPAQP
jgi:hypothetical protein